MKTTDRILYARKCDITGEGMNEGYCIQDGLMYIKYEKDMIKHIREGNLQFTQEAQEFYTEVYDRVEDVIIKELSR